MDEKRISITPNVSSVTISRTTAEKLQRKQPIIRKGSPKRDASKPNDSEVQSMAVDQTVWTKARERAEEIATDIIRSQTNSSNTELSPEARAKVRSTANRLIVIDSDTSVTVYNTVSQATQARKAKREATQTDDMESTPE